MNGTIQFCSGEEGGFVAELELPEALGTHASRVPDRVSELTQEHAGDVRTHEATVTGRR